MKLAFVARGCVPPESEARNLAHTQSLGLRYVDEKERPSLAVVGGGPSVVDHLDELKCWNGDIWACSSAFPWLRDRGVNASFFCIDPHPIAAQFARGAHHAILSTCVDPGLLAELSTADVEVFDLIHTDGRGNHGVSTATAAPELSIRMGYRDVHFFGLDSSYADGKSHAYLHYQTENRIVVKCNGKSFLTDPALLMQAEYMAEMIRLCPLFKNRSGGLLEQLVIDIDYDITHGTQGLHARTA